MLGEHNDAAAAAAAATTTTDTTTTSTDVAPNIKLTIKIFP